MSFFYIDIFPEGIPGDSARCKGAFSLQVINNGENIIVEFPKDENAKISKEKLINDVKKLFILLLELLDG